MIENDIILALSVRSVRLHFLRSVLAALGIVIGVVAIASIGMMGANMTLSVTEQLSDMANKLTVTPYTGGGGGMMMGGGGGGRVVIGSGSSSDDDDVITEKQFKTIQRIVAKYGTAYTVRSESDRIEVGSDTGRATIYGLDPEIMREILTVEEGEYPKSTTSVAVGPTLAERLNLKIGSKLKIGDPDEGSTTTVRVVGILEERGMSMDLSTDMAIVGSDKLFVGIYGGEGEYDQVNVVVNDINNADAVKTAIEDELNRKEDTVTVHGQQPHDGEHHLVALHDDDVRDGDCRDLAPGCRGLDLQRDDDVGERTGAGRSGSSAPSERSEPRSCECSSTKRGSSGSSGRSSVPL